METKRKAEWLPFKDAVEQEASSAMACRCGAGSIPMLIAFYARQVRRLHDLFGKENILVILNEDLLHDHRGTLQKVLRFSAWMKPLSHPRPRSSSTLTRSQFEAEVQAGLINRFRSDIQELEQLLQRDLSPWYSPLHPRRPVRRHQNLTWFSVLPYFLLLPSS